MVGRKFFCGERANWGLFCENSLGGPTSTAFAPLNTGLLRRGPNQVGGGNIDGGRTGIKACSERQRW